MKSSVTRLIVGSAVLGSLVSLTACERTAKVESDKQQYSYAIGYQFAKNLKTQGVEVDSAALNQAVKDVLADKEAALNEEQMQAAMQKMYEGRREAMMKEAEGNKKTGEEFLAKNKEKEGVKITDSGLQYKVVREGEGKSPKEDDTVVVHYKGTLIDGTEFDSSYKRDQPAEFPVKAVIPGWTEALQKMKKGAKWELVIPSDLAYGERGRPSIPPNSVLLFEVELLEIKN